MDKRKQKKNINTNYNNLNIMKIQRLYLFILCLFLLILCFSCKSDSTKNKTDTVLDELPEEEILMEEEFYRFPSPEEIFGFITESEMEFRDGITTVNQVKDTFLKGSYIYISFPFQHRISIPKIAPMHCRHRERRHALLRRRVLLGRRSAHRHRI